MKSAVHERPARPRHPEVEMRAAARSLEQACDALVAAVKNFSIALASLPLRSVDASTSTRRKRR